MATSYLVNVQKSACSEQQRLTVISVEPAVMYIIHYGLTIYKAPPTAQGQWVSAYDNRKDLIYENTHENASRPGTDNNGIHAGILIGAE